MHLLFTIIVTFFAGMGAGLGTGFAGMSAAAVISPILITFLGIDPYIAVGIASSDYAEINAARNESGADDAEIDKKRDEKLAEIKEKADAALKKATAEGAAFAAVVKEYSSAYSETT